MTTNKPLMNRTGLYFEEYEVGQTIQSAGRTVTEADVVAFASLSGDWNSIHTDREYAAGQFFGQRVAHGLLGLSIASGLAVRLGFMEETVLAFREIGSWKFSQPIFLNDTIHLEAEVVELKSMPRLNGGQVTLKIELVNQKGTVVQKGNWGVLVKSREA